MPRVIKKRSDKKTLSEDNLQGTVSDIREKIRGKQRTLIYYLIVFSVVVIAVSGFFIYNKITTGKAQELEHEGYKLLYGDARALPSLSPDRYKNALEKFKASYAARKNPVALLYIANCYYELGSYDETVKSLKELISQYSDPKIAPIAYYKMSMAYIKKNDMANALNTLNSLSSIKDSAFQDMAIMESGKILESMGKAEEAKNKYKELIGKFPKSALVDEAKAKMGN